MTLPNDYIFLPLLAQILLTLAVYVRLGAVKARASRNGEVDAERRALHADAWPEKVQQINNNIRNQFEAPVLFYVLVLVLYAIGAADAVGQGLAWVFVLSRAVHAYVHTGSNYVPVRRKAFMFGCVVLLVMLVYAAYCVIA